ncbi:hypothetical protein NQ317_016925 [Molorchus minor]|uniref:Uncharacterized protein n=1 Tax=Molorchus minor TaxID=1323400 RepID=A0ABQ9K570_9CUCU|nr:hypothetical protein NQ317_016925 [Molorchus minor]
MVIKSKNKTRAKQRKGAVANWKRVGKVTITALKKRGLTGEQMRCLMWGRESINTPVKVKGPTKDPLKDPQGPNLTGGFGNALTTALDVMAFTHELDINGAAQGLNLSNNTKPASKELINPQNLPVNVALNNQKNTTLNMQGKNVPSEISGSAMMGALAQLTDSKGFTEPSATIKNAVPSSLSFPIQSHPVEIDDPLRELVLCSIDKDADPEKLKFLALSAANLAKEKEIMENEKNIPKSVKSLAGIFTGTETFVKKVEENIRKKYAALEPSDSEGLGEEPLLGQISRTRRAKSAHMRNSSAKSKLSDKRKLIAESDSSSTDTILTDRNETAGNKNLEDYDPRNRVRIVQKNENATQNVTQIDMKQEELTVTMSETVTVRGCGNGTENESGNIQKRKKRSKTAKTNRVAPAVDQRPCKSANERLESEGSESPDPLEPWSTKDITNMNKILAWDNEDNNFLISLTEFLRKNFDSVFKDLGRDDGGVLG